MGKFDDDLDGFDSDEKKKYIFRLKLLLRYLD